MTPLATRVAELERRVKMTVLAGNKIAAHLRNCGGCIGCDEAIEEWKAAAGSEDQS